MDLRDRVLELVECRNHVSFHELCKLDGARGDLAMTSTVDKNIVLWNGVSHELVEALDGLRVDGKIHMHPTSTFVYMIDGGIPRFPLAKRVVKGGYKNPHWLPVTLVIGDSKECDSKRKRSLCWTRRGGLPSRPAAPPSLSCAP